MGRRWQRGLRRSGFFARRVLVGRGEAGRPNGLAVDGGEARNGFLPQPDVGRSRRRPRLRRPLLAPPVPTELGPLVAGPDTDRTTEPADGGDGADQPPDTAGQPGTAEVVRLLTGPHTWPRRIQFSVVTACSLASLLCGTAAVMLAIGGAPRLGALLLIGSVIFDGLDGPLARRMKVSTPFGAQLDSLVDMCSFGVAAPVVTYVWLLDSDMPAWMVAPACVVVAAGAALRLARFNVSPKDDSFFCGVPTTNVALVLSVFVAIAPAQRPVWWMVPLMLVLGIGMTTSFPYAKVGQVLRLPPWLWLVALFGAILIDVTAIFALAVCAYLASGPVISAWRRRPGRPSPA